MSLYADIYRNGTRQGRGPVTLERASVTRSLDSEGEIRFKVPGTDPKMLNTLTNESRVRIFYGVRDKFREIGRGIVQENISSDQGMDSTYDWRGPDSLNELQRYNTYFNLTYDDQPVCDVVADLISMVPGWSYVCNVSTLMSARLDGMKVFSALLKIAEINGLHMRVSPGSNTVEIGSFGTVNSVRATNIRQLSGSALKVNSDIALIKNMTIKSISRAVANRLTPLGGGQNADASITLADSDRSDPYPILSMTKNGREIYYIEDSDSIAQYGVIEDIRTFKQVVPLGVSNTARKNASNGLYDWAASWLSQHAYEQTVYSFTLTHVNNIFNPGEKIRVIYRGEIPITHSGGPLVYREIDETMTILEVTESVDANEGLSVSLVVSNVDRYETTASQAVAGSIEEVRLRGLASQPTFVHWWDGPEQGLIDSDNDVSAKIIFSDETYAIDRVLLNIRTRPFVATSKGAAAGGDHRHTVAQYADGPFSAPTNFRVYGAVGKPPNYVPMYLLMGESALSTDPTEDFVTWEASGDHVHPMEYGIFQDDQFPSNVSVTVNGVTVASGLDPDGDGIETTIDITDAVNGRSGGIQGDHPVIVSCGGGQGEVLLKWSVNEQILTNRKT